MQCCVSLQADILQRSGVDCNSGDSGMAKFPWQSCRSKWQAARSHCPNMSTCELDSSWTRECAFAKDMSKESCVAAQCSDADCGSGHPCVPKVFAHSARSIFLRHGIPRPCPATRAEERILVSLHLTYGASVRAVDSCSCRGALASRDCLC